MDQIKLLVKEVLHKIQDIPDVPFTPVRMSEIASKSPQSLHTSKSTSEQNVPFSTKLTMTSCINNNETSEVTSSQSEQFEEETDEKPTHLFPEVVEIRKASDNLQSLYIGERGSRDSVFNDPSPSPVSLKSHRSKIVMGKKALLRSRSGELQSDPATVVHELVHEKYQDKISHYIGRMYRRRLSRESRSTDDDGTSSNYSTGSLKTPDSLYDGKSYFSLFFPPSTEDLNKDTTTKLFNSTANSIDGNDADLEYDPRTFLENALGDLSYDTQCTDTSLKNSKLLYSQSVDTVNGPSLLSKAGSLYSSVRKSLRRACSFRDRSNDAVTPRNKVRNRDRCQSFSPECFCSSENLMQELYVQNGTIFQVTKALSYCRSSGDVTSPEYVEAEKILLVASCHKQAIQAALNAIEFGEKEHHNQTYLGSVEISEVVYYLKADLFTVERTPQRFDEYFVIVVTSGKNVLSSKVLMADKNGEIKPDRKFCFTGLPTNFTIEVSIHSMRVNNVAKNNGNHAKHHHKKDRKPPCPSTKSFFHLNHHKSSRKNLLVDSVSSIKPSSFTLWGTCIVNCSDLGNTHFRMHKVPLCSTLEGYFTAVLTGDVKLTNRTAGFLTIGVEDKSHLTWNRRWCLLDGALLRYWNYPSEEFSRDPIGLIDLAYATESTSPADRSVCSRPKTLSLMIRNGDDPVLRYFLSADSQEEKAGWQKEINFVIGTLSSWNCLRSKKQVTSF